MNKLSSIVLTLSIFLGIGGHGLAQQNSPISAEELSQLVRRIEILEQTVQELQAQLAIPKFPLRSGYLQPRYPRQPRPSFLPRPQDIPKNDRAIKISGLAFGDFYWMGRQS